MKVLFSGAAGAGGWVYIVWLVGLSPQWGLAFGLVFGGLMYQALCSEDDR